MTWAGHCGGTADPDMTRGMMSKVALAVFGIAIAAVAAEAGLRAAGLGYGSAPLISDPVVHHVHPRNYSFVVHDPTREFGGHTTRYDDAGLTIDPNSSLRTVAPPGGPAPMRVAFLGDSFTEATQVPYRQSFVGLVSRTLTDVAEVRNYGISSYSPVLELLQWEHVVQSFRPTHVFVLLGLTDSLEDEVYRAQARLDPRGRIVAVSGPRSSWWAQQWRKSYLLRFMRRVEIQAAWYWRFRNNPQPVVGGYQEERDPQISELTSRTVEALAKAVGATGARFILMVVPSKFRLEAATPVGEEFSEKWRRWASRRGVAFVDLVGPFRRARAEGIRPFFDYDIHFNCRGHRVVATEVLRALGVVMPAGGEAPPNGGDQSTGCS